MEKNLNDFTQISLPGKGIVLYIQTKYLDKLIKLFQQNSIKFEACRYMF